MNGLQACIDRLDKTRFFECDVVGNGDNSPVYHVGHHAYVFRETASIRIEPRRNARLLVNRALRKQLSFAIKAVTARNVVKADHSITCGPALDTNSCFDDGSRDFVTENLRRFYKIVADFLDICPTYAASGDSNENFTGSDFRNGHSFEDNTAVAPIYARAHFGRDNRRTPAGICLQLRAHRDICSAAIRTLALFIMRNFTYRSRNVVRLRIAADVSSPKRTNAGILTGFLMSSPIMRGHATSPRLVTVRLKSIGSFRSAVSEIARIATAGTAERCASVKMWK